MEVVVVEEVVEEEALSYNFGGAAVAEMMQKTNFKLVTRSRP